MRKRTWCLAIVLSLFLMLFVASSSWAQITSLHVARGSTGALWSMDCIYGSCSAWSLITGNFAAQPTLSYDPAWGRFILMGVSAANAIWRSTFNGITGAFNYDWVQLAGTSNSPLASSGGAIVTGWAKMNANGTIDSCLNCNTDLAHTDRIGTGQYEVDFDFGIQNSPRTATLDTQGTGSVTGQIGLADRSGDSTSVYIRTTDSAGAYDDQPFTIVIYNW